MDGSLVTLYIGQHYCEYVSKKLDTYTAVEWKLLQLINYCELNGESHATYKFNMHANTSLTPEEYTRHGFKCIVSRDGRVSVIRILE